MRTLAAALALLAASALAQSAPSPRLSATLHWMQNSLAAGGGLHEEDGTTELTSLDFKGCALTVTAHFDYSPRTKLEIRQTDSFDLRDIDPTSIVILKSGGSTIRLHTINNDPGRVQSTSEYNPQANTALAPGHRYPGFGTGGVLVYDLSSHAYAVRFTRALRRAIELCGGRPSTF